MKSVVILQLLLLSFDGYGVGGDSLFVLFSSYDYECSEGDSIFTTWSFASINIVDLKR